MKKHHSPVEYLSPTKRRRTVANTRNDERQRKQGNSSHVCCWMDYESIESIQYLPPTTTLVPTKSSPSLIRPQIASSTMTEIFLNRLHKEIVAPFRFTLSSQIQLLDSDQSVHDATDRRNEIQKRLLFGYNNVSKLLFDANIGKAARPLLIVMVLPCHNFQTESLPPHHHASTIGAAMLQHIPLLAYDMNVPLLLLPSFYNATTEIQTRGKSDTTHALATIFGYGNHKSNHHIQHLSCIAFAQKMTLAAAATTTTGDGPLDTHEHHQHYQIHNTVDSFVNYITGKMQI